MIRRFANIQYNTEEVGHDFRGMQVKLSRASIFFLLTHRIDLGSKATRCVSKKIALSMALNNLTCIPRKRDQLLLVIIRRGHAKLRLAN